MWHKSILVGVLCTGSLTSGQEPYHSFSVGDSVADQSRKITSVAMEGSKLWYATHAGEVFTKEPAQTVGRVINEHQSRQRFPACVTTCHTGRSSRVCFGSDTLHMHTNRATSWHSEGDKVTTLSFSPTGRYLFATLFNKQSAQKQIARLVGFDVRNGSLPDTPNCSVELSGQVTTLCKITQKGSGDNVRIALVEGGRTIKVLHGDVQEESYGVTVASTHALLHSPIVDIAWYKERQLCITSGKQVCIKSYTGGDPTFSLTTSVPLGPVHVVDNTLVVGTNDGRVMLIDMQGNRLKILTTLALSTLGRAVCHITGNALIEQSQLTCLVEDDRSKEGDFLNWPPATPEASEVVRAVELKRVDGTLEQLKRFPRVTDPLPNAACKKWSTRIGGGLCTVSAVTYFLYWLTYCTHQSEGVWCP